MKINENLVRKSLYIYKLSVYFLIITIYMYIKWFESTLLIIHNNTH